MQCRIVNTTSRSGAYITLSCDSTGRWYATWQEGHNVVYMHWGTSSLGIPPIRRWFVENGGRSTRIPQHLEDIAVEEVGVEFQRMLVQLIVE